MKPLTKNELADEAAGWLSLLKSKAIEISAAEIGVRHMNSEIEKFEALLEFVEEEEERDLDKPSLGDNTPNKPWSPKIRPTNDDLWDQAPPRVSGKIDKIVELEERNTEDNAVASTIRSATKRIDDTLLKKTRTPTNTLQHSDSLKESY